MSSVTLPLAELSALISDAVASGASSSEHVKQITQLRGEVVGLKSEVSSLRTLAGDHFEGSNAPAASAGGEDAAANAPASGSCTLYINFLSGQTTTLTDVSSVDTIAALKTRINEMGGPAFYEQRLMFQGEELSDEQTLGSCGLCHRATVHMVDREWLFRRNFTAAFHSEPFNIIAKTLDGKTLTLKGVNSSERIDDLKARIQDIDGYPPDQQRLVFRGFQLEDGRQVGEYGLCDGDVIHIVLRLRGC